jgi:hypothetical protein
MNISQGKRTHYNPKMNQSFVIIEGFKYFIIMLHIKIKAFEMNVNIEVLNREIGNIKKNQAEILKLKNTV